MREANACKTNLKQDKSSSRLHLNRTAAEGAFLFAGAQIPGRQMLRCSQTLQRKSRNKLIATAMRSLWWLMEMVTWMWSL